MNIKFAELQQAMTEQLNRNSVVANNLANINSNGYKRDVMFSELLRSKSDSQIQSKLATDFSQGGLEETNNPMDLAISGEGFFTVDAGDKTVYTRDGHFSRGADGYLNTSGGLPVMGQSGWIDLGQGDANIGEVRVDLNGDVFVDGEFMDRLEISIFENSGDLKKIGSNLFEASPGAIDSRQEDAVILQGKVEGSNVDAVHEMIELIELQRNFETAQKAINTLDDAEGKAANNIGNYR